MTYDVTAPVPDRLRALADILGCPTPFDKHGAQEVAEAPPHICTDLEAMPFCQRCIALKKYDDRCVACELYGIAELLDPEGARALRDKRIQKAIAS